MKHWFSLTEEEKKTRSIQCAIVCLLIAVVSLIALIYFSKQTSDRLELCTEETNGYTLNFYSGRYVRSHLTAAFEIEGRTYTAVGLYKSSDFTFDERLNGHIPVKIWYEKGNPDNAYANRPPYFDPIWYVIPFVFGAGFLLFILQAKNPKKKRESIIQECKYKDNQTR